MSGFEARDASAPNARDVTAQAVDWLIERDATDAWTAENQAAFEAWLAESSAHRVAYWRLEASWSRAEIVGDMGPFRAEGRSAVRFGHRWMRFSQFAAGFAVIAALGAGAITYLNNIREQVYATPLGGHRIIALADGSQIELNTDTEIRIGTGVYQRNVALVRGEAYFQVKHDNAHQFVVAAAHHRVTDLGTKFLLRTNDDRLEVTLVDGRARIDADDGAKTHSSVLSPGDVAVATPTSMSVAKKPAQILANDLSWRRGMLVFDDTTLADAAQEFNRYNAEKIVIADPHAARMKISGVLMTNDLAEFLRMARNFFNLRADRRGSEIVVSR